MKERENGKQWKKNAKCRGNENNGNERLGQQSEEEV